MLACHPHYGDCPSRDLPGPFYHKLYMQKETRFSTIPTSEKITAIYNCLFDKKGQDILTLDVTDEGVVYDGVVIATATSLRHGQGLSDSVLELCRQDNIEFLNIEGYAVGEWILLDLNDVIVHIFQEETRDMYKLDDLWPNATALTDSMPLE